MTVAQNVLEEDLAFLNLKEVAEILRIAPISVYRLIAKQGIPVYRTCRKILFKKQDVVAFIEKRRQEPKGYGSAQG
jgi:excisionase family DNA binding protein